MSGIGFKLDPVLGHSNYLIQNSDLALVALSAAHRLNLDLVLCFQRFPYMVEVVVRAHCDKVVSVDHDGNVHFPIMKQAWVGSTLNITSCSQRVAVFQCPIKGGISSAVHAHHEFSALTLVSSLEIFFG